MPKFRPINHEMAAAYQRRLASNSSEGSVAGMQFESRYHDSIKKVSDINLRREMKMLEQQQNNSHYLVGVMEEDINTRAGVTLKDGASLAMASDAFRSTG